MNHRNITPSQFIGYGLYPYFLGVSFRNTAKALSFLHMVNINHAYIWKWIQKHRPKKASRKKKNIPGYSCIQKDEEAIMVGSEYVWLWFAAVEPKDKEILATCNM